MGGFFGRAKKAVEEAAEEAEEQPQKKKAAPFANLLGGGTGKVAAKAEVAAQKAEAAAGKQARQAAAAASRGSKRAAAAAEKPAKQARGFFNKAAAAVGVHGFLLSCFRKCTWQQVTIVGCMARRKEECAEF